MTVSSRTSKHEDMSGRFTYVELTPEQRCEEAGGVDSLVSDVAGVTVRERTLFSFNCYNEYVSAGRLGSHKYSLKPRTTQQTDTPKRKDDTA